MAYCARQTNLEFLQDDTVLAEELTEENAGTLIIVVGVSHKGLGAKGLTLEQEKQRIRSLLDKAEAIGVDVILAYVEEKRTGVDLLMSSLTSYFPEA